jgi:uncharacterized coiled-coil protein SlyX
MKWPFCLRSDLDEARERIADLHTINREDLECIGRMRGNIAVANAERDAAREQLAEANRLIAAQAHRLDKQAQQIRHLEAELERRSPCPSAPK